MTQITTIQTAQEQQYETPTYSPRGAFATTLRSAEMARKGSPVQQQSRTQIVREPRQVDRTEQRYETPTFSPRGAFATTLRSAERRHSATRALDVLAYAA